MANQNKMTIYYMSIEGNTKHFLHVMSREFKNVDLHEITDQDDLFKFKAPFFCFIPTYVKGTQRDPKLHEKQPGINMGITEIDTNTMNDELGYQNNYKHCLGLIGSGNKNFGDDCYCWTSLHYHLKYGIPLLDDFELRGTSADENRINHRLVSAWNSKTPTKMHVDESSHQMANPRLKALEQKYGNLH